MHSRRDRTAMRVQFHRTGKRQYRVVVVIPGRPPLEMNSAPGYDDLMPHDLQHFIVERTLGIRNGLFGQLCQGGSAGTFHHENPGEASKREAKASKRKTDTLARAGREDSLVSERATYIAWQDWLQSHKSADARARGAEGYRAVDLKQDRQGRAQTLFCRKSCAPPRRDGGGERRMASNADRRIYRVGLGGPLNF